MNCSIERLGGGDYKNALVVVGNEYLWLHVQRLLELVHKRGFRTFNIDGENAVLSTHQDFIAFEYILHVCLVEKRLQNGAEDLFVEGEVLVFLALQNEQSRLLLLQIDESAAADDG